MVPGSTVVPVRDSGSAVLRKKWSHLDLRLQAAASGCGPSRFYFDILADVEILSRRQKTSFLFHGEPGTPLFRLFRVSFYMKIFPDCLSRPLSTSTQDRDLAANRGKEACFPDRKEEAHAPGYSAPTDPERWQLLKHRSGMAVLVALAQSRWLVDSRRNDGGDFAEGRAAHRSMNGQFAP